VVVDIREYKNSHFFANLIALASYFFSRSEKNEQGRDCFLLLQNNTYLCSCRSFQVAFAVGGMMAERFIEARLDEK